MKVRYTFRFYPNEAQEIALAKEFGCARYAYNFGLRWWTENFRAGEKPNYAKCSAAWTKERNSLWWAKQSSCIPQQQALRHLKRAFTNFFEKRAKYPKFKKKNGKQTAEFTKSGFKFNSQNRTLTVSKVGKLKLRWSRDFQSSPTTVTITKRPSGKYFVTLCLDEPQKIPFPKTNASVGVDFGITRLATLSNGETIANPKHTAKYARKLAKAQRILSRRKKGSNRWKLQKQKVARIHEKIADSRQDVLHKFSLDLIKRFDDVCIENLHVRGMAGNKKLSKALSDCSFSMARAMLEYKANWYGKRVWVIDRFFPSSKTCSNCSYIVESLPLNIRNWTCPECNERHDRDINAAQNILAVGHTVAGRGLNVRPNRTSVCLGNPG